MTYRSSYFKLCLEDMRRRLVIVIITIALFLSYSAQFVLSMLSEFMFFEDMTREEKILTVAEMCVPDVFECVLAMLMGIFLAAQGFQFLHSKRKMDFYGALPISRPRRFAVLCTNQFVLFTIPLLVVKGIEMLVVMVSGLGSVQAYLNIINATICAWFSFLAMWAITAFVVIATGHLALSLAGTVIISAYVPLCRFVIYEGCCSMLLNTYVSAEPASFWYALSPFSVLYKLMPSWENSWTVWTWKEDGIWIPVLALYAIVFGTASYFLYLRRQNEAAGRAMAFPKGNRIVQILLVIPCGILSGLMTSIWVSWLNVWLIIPFVIFGCCFVHMLLECIFHYNIRKVFIHKWQMIITTAVTVWILLFIGFDVVGYDAYFPEATEIRAVYVATYNDEMALEPEKIDKTVEMSDSLKEDILDFVAPMLAQSQDVNVNDIFGTSTYEVTSVDVIYVTKNGQLKQRSYTVSIDYDWSKMTTYYDTEEYRQLMWASKIEEMSRYDTKYVQWIDLANASELTLTSEETEELIDIYLEEYNQTSIQDRVLGELYITYDEGNWYSEGYQSLYVNEKCVKTLAYLENKGVTIIDYDSAEVVSLEIYYYEDYLDEAEEVIIKDKEILAKYRDQIKMSYDGSDHWSADYYIYATILVDGEEVMVSASVSEETYEALKNEK